MTAQEDEKEVMMDYLKKTADAMATAKTQQFITIYNLWLKYGATFKDFNHFLADFDEKFEIFLKRFEEN